MGSLDRDTILKDILETNRAHRDYLLSCITIPTGVPYTEEEKTRLVTDFINVERLIKSLEGCE